jgi:hypothetical protein
MKKMLISSVLVCLTVILFNSCKGKSGSVARVINPLTPEQLIQRGDYLEATLGCDDCHSPKKMGPQGPEVIPELRLSGYQADLPLPQVDISILQKGWVLFTIGSDAAVGPWGVSFSANLTSDETGIGNWTEENFVRAIREGKYKGIEASRSLLPPMPWADYAKLNDDDLKAVYAFLKNTKPVRNVVPLAIAPADIR